MFDMMSVSFDQIKQQIDDLEKKLIALEKAFVKFQDYVLENDDNFDNGSELKEKLKKI